MNQGLFRGQRLSNKVWVEGFYVCVDNEHHYIFVGKRDTSGLYPTFIYYEVDPKTVGQFTGAPDKNGKKVFDGDIVICDGEHKYFVRYCNQRAMYELRRTDDCSGSNGMWIDIPSRCEVIGNIHDNLEPLEV